MKKFKFKFNKVSIIILAVAFTLGLGGIIAVQAATTPTLGTASTFGVLSSTFTNSNTSPYTIITGDVGYTTGPTTVPLTISGTTHTADSAYNTAGIDQGTALTALNNQSCTTITGPLNATIIGSNAPGVFPPGCYTMAGNLIITLSTSIILDLTAPGGTGNTWIFKSTGGGLTTGQDSFVTLANGASACNVFWVPVAATNIGAYTGALPNTTKLFIGTIIDASGISLGHFANLLGQALAFGGTVTTDANRITVPICAAPVIRRSSSGSIPRVVVPVFQPTIDIISTPVVYVAPVIPMLPKTGFPPRESGTWYESLLNNILNLFR